MISSKKFIKNYNLDKLQTFIASNEASDIIKYIQLRKPLGQLIKAMRLESRLTQEELASLMNVTRQLIQKWEYSIINPTPKNLFKLTELLFDKDFEDVFKVLIREFY